MRKNAATAVSTTPPIVAAVMALNNYPIGIDKARLQRVADEMLQFGLLHTRFDISQLLGP